MKGRIRWKIWSSIVCMLFLSVGSCGCTGLFRPGVREQSVITKETGYGESENSTNENETGHTQDNIIYVHVCGCVKNPGLYTFASGTRAGSAVEKAGGFTKKADLSAVNLAAILTDGMQLYVPSVKEEMSGSVSQKSTLVNINTAIKDELMTLSGIGEARAEAILSYREENGFFSSIEDIKNVSGIGEGIFERIKNMITV